MHRKRKIDALRLRLSQVPSDSRWLREILAEILNLLDEEEEAPVPEPLKHFDIRVKGKVLGCTWGEQGKASLLRAWKEGQPKGRTSGMTFRESSASECVRCRHIVFFPIHKLVGGLPLCGFSTKLPKDWPPGHTWSSKDTDVTCPGCKVNLT